MWLRSILRGFVRLPVVYPCLALLLARRGVVRGWSMFPTLAPGEYVLFDSLAYRLDIPRRGEIALVDHPTRPAYRIVKRVVAVPGDEVAVSEGVCWVNGEAHTEAAPSAAPTESAQTWTLADSEYFLVGDAPDMSTDARQFGPVERTSLRGRAWLVYWPPRRSRVVKR